MPARWGPLTSKVRRARAVSGGFSITPLEVRKPQGRRGHTHSLRGRANTCGRRPVVELCALGRSKTRGPRRFGERPYRQDRVLETALARACSQGTLYAATRCAVQLETRGFEVRLGGVTTPSRARADGWLGLRRGRRACVYTLENSSVKVSTERAQCWAIQPARPRKKPGGTVQVARAGDASRRNDRRPPPGPRCDSPVPARAAKLPIGMPPRAMHAPLSAPQRSGRRLWLDLVRVQPSDARGPLQPFAPPPLQPSPLEESSGTGPRDMRKCLPRARMRAPRRPRSLFSSFVRQGRRKR